MKKSDPVIGDDMWEAPPKPRRRHSRVGISFPCDIEHSGSISQGRLYDLSISGAFVESDKVPPVGDPIEVSIHPSGEEKELTLAAVIRHQNPHKVGETQLSGCGVEFRRVSQEARSHIQTLLSRCTSA